MTEIITDETTEFETTTCQHCSSDIDPEEIYEVEGHILCYECYCDDTSTCTRCGTRLLNRNNAGNENTVLCQDCYDNEYTRCDDCGALIHNDNSHRAEYNDDEFCHDCYAAREESRKIHDYYYKPEPIFYGDGNRFLGVELEIDHGGEDSDNAETLLRVGNNKDEHIYIKHDGSLDSGIELVSHPMSLSYHQHQMPWRGLSNMALDLGYRSHKTDTCGLHVHVSREAFGETYREQEDAIARVLYFVEAHWLEILRFSRRTEGQMSRWAARYGRKDNPKDVLYTAKESGARYSCINLTNNCTIEFRMFRGTLKYNTFIATLQLVDQICDVAISMSDKEMQELSWTSFVTDIKSSELIQYLKERRLYVNEPLQTEEEI